MPTNIFSPQSIAIKLAERLRARRLAEDWSRRTLAERSGVPESTIKRFETHGSIGLEALVMLALTLDAADEFAQLFPAKTLTSIEQVQAPQRQGRR